VRGNPLAGAPARIGQTSYDLVMLSRTPSQFKEIQDELLELRPTRTSKWTGQARISHYNEQKPIWDMAFNAWYNYIVPAAKAAARAQKHPGDKEQLQNKNPAAIRILQKSLQAAGELKYGKGDKRDQKATEWKENFTTLVRDKLLPLAGMPRTYSMSSSDNDEDFESHDECERRHGRDDAACRKDASCAWDGMRCVEKGSTEFFSMAQEPSYFDLDMCKQRHGTNRLRCQADRQCSWNGEECEEK